MWLTPCCRQFWCAECRRGLIFSSNRGFISLCTGTEGSRQWPHCTSLRLPASVRLWGQRLHSRLPKLTQLLQQRGRPRLRLSQRLGSSLSKTGGHVRRKWRLEHAATPGKRTRWRKRKISCRRTQTASDIPRENDRTVTKKIQKKKKDKHWFRIFFKNNQSRIIVVVYAYICLLKA